MKESEKCELLKWEGNCGAQDDNAEKRKLQVLVDGEKMKRLRELVLSICPLKELDPSVIEEDREKEKEYLLSCLGEKQKEMRRELDLAMEKENKKYESDMEKISQIHTSMMEKTNQLQSSWARILDEAYEKMSGVKRDFYGELINWQKDLFFRELRPIAENYIELYRITQNLNETVTKVHMRQRDYEDTDGMQEMTHQQDDFSSHLVDLDRKLEIISKKFEKSLNALGLYVYYPKEGEEFDEILHSVAGEKVKPEGAVVRNCLVPGIARRTKEGPDADEIIIAAQVEVAESYGRQEAQEHGYDSV